MLPRRKFGGVSAQNVNIAGFLGVASKGCYLGLVILQRALERSCSGQSLDGLLSLLVNSGQNHVPLLPLCEPCILSFWVFRPHPELPFHVERLPRPVENGLGVSLDLQEAFKFDKFHLFCPYWVIGVCFLHL